MIDIPKVLPDAVEPALATELARLAKEAGMEVQEYVTRVLNAHVSVFRRESKALVTASPDAAQVQAASAPQPDEGKTGAEDKKESLAALRPTPTEVEGAVRDFFSGISYLTLANSPSTAFKTEVVPAITRQYVALAKKEMANATREEIIAAAVRTAMGTLPDDTGNIETAWITGPIAKQVEQLLTEERSIWTDIGFIAATVAQQICAQRKNGAILFTKGQVLHIADECLAEEPLRMEWKNFACVHRAAVREIALENGLNFDKLDEDEQSEFVGAVRYSLKLNKPTRSSVLTREEVRSHIFRVAISTKRMRALRTKMQSLSVVHTWKCADDVEEDAIYRHIPTEHTDHSLAQNRRAFCRGVRSMLVKYGFKTKQLAIADLQQAILEYLLRPESLQSSGTGDPGIRLGGGTTARQRYGKMKTDS